MMPAMRPRSRERRGRGAERDGQRREAVGLIELGDGSDLHVGRRGEYAAVTTARITSPRTWPRELQLRGEAVLQCVGETTSDAAAPARGTEAGDDVVRAQVDDRAAPADHRRVARRDVEEDVDET